MELNGFNSNAYYVPRSPALNAGADVAFGAGKSKTQVENSAAAQASGGRVALQASGGTAWGDGKPSEPGKATASGRELTKEQESQVRELKKRDAQVRAHEQAHANVGGSYASAPTYTYTKGPDGKKYAIGGEVQIDTSPERTPDATIRKMDIVIAAALAPSDPSSQDRAVARQAQQQRMEAQTQLAAQRAGERADLSANSDGVDEGNGTGLSAGVLAQILAQADNEAEDGDAITPGSAFSATAAAAASAYKDAVKLSAALFDSRGV